MGYRGVAGDENPVGYDTRDLEKHGNQWRAQRKVPVRLREVIGKAKLVRGLGTDSLARAHILKRPIIAEFDRIIAEAERRLNLQSNPKVSPLMAEAHEFRAELAKAEADPEAYADHDEDGEVIVSGPEWVRGLISDRSMELARDQGSREARAFYGIASGTATPILTHIEGFFTEKAMKARQDGSYRTALRKFDKWLTDNRRLVTIEAVLPRVVGDFVRATYIEPKVNPKTANKDISACSSYWRWMIKRGYTEVNPWAGQSLSKRQTTEDEDKRAFTDAELTTLLAGDASPLLRDFMTIAALTGLRIGEIAQLEARDIAEGRIKVRLSKTKAGLRSFPIHSDLHALLERRSAGRTGTDTLFPDLRPVSGDCKVELSQPITKAFTRYRRKLGIGEAPEGQRQAVADFHSFRRWFIRKAVDALSNGATGYSPYVLAGVVGHEKKAMDLGMTMGVYAGKDDDEKAKRACVEAVRLPRKTIPLKH